MPGLDPGIHGCRTAAPPGPQRCPTHFPGQARQRADPGARAADSKCETSPYLSEGVGAASGMRGGAVRHIRSTSSGVSP